MQGRYQCNPTDSKAILEAVLITRRANRSLYYSPGDDVTMGRRPLIKDMGGPLRMCLFCALARRVHIISMHTGIFFLIVTCKKSGH